MPDNPISGKAGNLTRCSQVLDYLTDFEEKKEIYFLSISDWGLWDIDNTRKFKARFPSVKLKLLSRKFKNESFFKYLFLYKIPYFFSKLWNGKTVDITNPYLNYQVSKFIEKEKFDYVIISYSSWGNIISTLHNKPYLIVDTHDFITAQQRKNKKNIGKIFQSELNILRKFDEIWTFSVEEKFIYEQFTDALIVYQPVAFPLKPIQPIEPKKYDIIYVASINPHNIKGIQWFLKEVLPLIPQYNVHIIGKISETISTNYPNVTKHGIVENIDHYYENARLSICPMLSGTGVKIKVLESLSHNLPVVTNTRGVDGLSNKYNNGCLVSDHVNEFANYINQLMNDNDFYDSVRHQGNEYFKANHNLSDELKFFKDKFHK